MNNISVQALIEALTQASTKFPDCRTGKNCHYSITDATLGAYSAFFMQSPSFLASQEMLQETIGKNNAITLFNLKRIPSDNHIRNLLDTISPDHLTPVFHDAFSRLKTTGILSDFQTDLGDTGNAGNAGDAGGVEAETRDTEGKGGSNLSYLVALDGTGYFSSDNISCDNCSTKTSKQGKTKYSHQVLLPALVKAGKSEVIPLPPEFITPQDGHKKQDCENMAAKRWLKTHGHSYQNLDISILGDDLYSRQPVIEAVNRQGFNYILVCKESSHSWMYQHINALEINPNTPSGQTKKYLKSKDILHSFTTKKWDGKHHILTNYRFAQQVPLKDDDKALLVNWVEIIQTKEWTDKAGELQSKQIYKNAFITDHPLSAENTPLIVEAGRTRWKVENEDINTLKTKGYYFTHSYGHGKKHLASFLLSLIMIAFLHHTLLELGDQNYQKLRKHLRIRKRFHEHLNALTAYFVWESWDQLFDFMWKKLNNQAVSPPG